VATTKVMGEFSLLHPVNSTMSNARTQEEPVTCFTDAARHPRPGGPSVLEPGIPPQHHIPPGQSAVPFEVRERHTWVDTHDLISQQRTSHRYSRLSDADYGDSLRDFGSPWPSEGDLRTRQAGTERGLGWAHGDHSQLTAEYRSPVSVWRKSE